MKAEKARESEKRKDKERLDFPFIPLGKLQTGVVFLFAQILSRQAHSHRREDMLSCCAIKVDWVIVWRRLFQ
jgi:hypothetical protein